MWDNYFTLIKESNIFEKKFVGSLLFLKKRRSGGRLSGEILDRKNTYASATLLACAMRSP